MSAPQFNERVGGWIATFTQGVKPDQDPLDPILFETENLNKPRGLFITIPARRSSIP